MKERRIIVSLVVLGLGLMLAIGTGWAQGPADRVEPAGGLSIEAVVESKFSYQGRLSEGGVGVNGERDMAFQIYTDEACTTPASGSFVIPDVEAVNGFFSVDVSVLHDQVRGEGLWLRIEVEGTDVVCQKILPVPYALSLRPGARIEGQVVDWDVVHVVNSATAGISYGLWAETQASEGLGVYAYASAISGANTGLYARTDSTDGAGVYARGRDAGADLILAGNADTTAGDDGRLYSDPSYPSSDLILEVNDGVRIDLDQDADGEDADLEIRNAADTLILNVDESGDVTCGGTGIAAFPHPAWDSGWLTMGLGEDRVVTHSLGRNIDNYVVDLTCRSSGEGVNNWGAGGDANWDGRGCLGRASGDYRRPQRDRWWGRASRHGVVHDRGDHRPATGRGGCRQ